MYDVCIIGGGAAGMVCAVTAASRGKSVVIIEKNQALGKKICATGNGRCNISNSNCENAAKVLAFFNSLGLVTKTENEGRIYPASNQAADVVFLLEKRLNALGVQVMCGCAADWAAKKKNGFEVSCASRQISCRSLVLAAGGKAAPQFGTTGDGYSLALSLGHSISKPIPVLTAIETVEDISHLKGVRVAAECSLTRKGETVFRETGEVQFTDYGLSGICIFNMSRHLLLSEDIEFTDYKVRLDFGEPFFQRSERSDFLKMLKDRSGMPGFLNKDLLRSIVPQALAKDIVIRAGMDPVQIQTGNMTDIMNIFCNWTVTVKGAKGWKMAQCTKGGVVLDEIDMETMESKMCSGLFLAGELIDYDGPCGGYNLQNAWETGLRAGENV